MNFILIIGCIYLIAIMSLRIAADIEEDKIKKYQHEFEETLLKYK